MPRLTGLPLPLVVVGLLGCGSNGGSAPPCHAPAIAALTDPNVVELIVDSGPAQAKSAYTNGSFISVTLCVPGTTTCQVVDHLLVDTGSMGVRVLESVLKLPLPAVTTDAGTPIAECTPFVDGTAWGPVKLADVQAGQEVAGSIPIQTIGEATFPNVPSSPACRGVPINTLDDLGSNGIFGVGILPQDCGTHCANAAQGLYFACSSATTCTSTAVPLDRQVPNPVTRFPVDNNGVAIQLPCVPPGGSTTVAGALVFGIGTQANNGLGSARPLAIDQSGYVTTAYPAGGTPYTSFLDSGSNALFFLDSAASGVRQCTAQGLTEFYCPPGTRNLSADISSPAGERVPVAFSVADASHLPGRSNAFSDLAGPMPGFPTDPTVPDFDWGLPFYFGRSVFTAIDGQPTPAGTGPYFAF